MGEMMNTKEVGEKLIALCQSGHFFEAIDTLYDENVVSVEAAATPDFPMELRGIQAIREKNQRWSDANEVHSVRGDGPWPHQDRFAIRWAFDVSPVSGPAKGQRVQFDEVAIYTVANGKVVKEEFFYDVPS